MSTIEFSDEQKAGMVSQLQRYFDDELSMELGQFDAEFLLDFFASNIGGHFYNRGLFDAQVVMDRKMDDIKAAIDEIEMPV
ncbi:DUF2164 domain-containing protein [Litorivivens sp.]|uniref:DUF2164 domain-containing protein n=1 Tax=Litorivivens sp. TaxID=2020868 RepID=UPI000C3C6312|nr:hypothetical protein [Spongiibacteraceae bacterium]MBN48089.1 hypothetical protein [Spongiibacteraceae bacterium]HCS28099.1 DUF2164 domain-containing protein [Spongiibacteraceae bacterium]